MIGHGVTLQRARFFSVVGVFALAGALLALLFNAPAAVAVAVDAPATVEGAAQIPVRIVVPAGQWLPVAGQTVVLESSGFQPQLLERATCWGDVSCEGGLVHATRPLGVIGAIERGPDGAVPSEGTLWVRVEGFGRSETTGYGQEVEPQRARRADDLMGDDGKGLGYGQADDETVLAYVVTLDTSSLSPGRYHLTFLVETGSASMGAVSSPRAPFDVR